MIKIAFWGQNQLSFQRACNVIKNVYGIQLSYITVMNITEFIGKLVYDYNYKKAYEIWENRANLDMTIKEKKVILYQEIDGATVNTRIDDENGSTWKENKLDIFFSEKDMYVRKDKSNIIKHKEFASYIGSVDTFRILVFAKAVELRYWEYEKMVFLSDGATWIRNMINELFPEAIQILDKFHLIENIYEYAKFIFKEDMQKVEEFKDKIINYCYSNDYNFIVKELEKYKDIKIPTTICNLPVYLENNKDKIDYSRYEKEGLFVGSGAIESSNKTITQSRLKQSGMRWSIDGANYMIALRCTDESENWDLVEKIVVDYFNN